MPSSSSLLSLPITGLEEEEQAPTHPRPSTISIFRCALAYNYNSADVIDNPETATRDGEEQAAISLCR